uniref:Uncharacterized protein n=1 Tax=Arundo donax TaxID=35708 RepID=A0A0A9D1A1_ARUDO
MSTCLTATHKQQCSQVPGGATSLLHISRLLSSCGSYKLPLRPAKEERCP